MGRDRGGDRWFIPDRHGIWIPPHLPHVLIAVSAIELQNFHVDPRYSARAAMPDTPTVVQATPLMRGIARRLAADTLSAPERRRLAWVALDEMARLGHSDPHLPGGRDPRVTAVVSHLLRQPRDASNLARLVEIVGTSERSLSRLLPIEMGLSWREWRKKT